MSRNETSRSSDDLRHTLHRIDGAGYGAYKQIKGIYDFGDFELIVDHVQGDPYARPSRVRVRMQQDVARLPQHYWEHRSREIGLRDYLTRRFRSEVRGSIRRGEGSGRSGAVVMDEPAQEILERTSVFVDEWEVEGRFLVGLPAQGRRILGREAARILVDELPVAVRAAFVFDNLDEADLRRHVFANEDQDALRAQLADSGLVAFVANGSLLPRRSGIDPNPMSAADAVRFRSPPSLEVAFALPNAGEVRGMGIPPGVTLIVGGGYHGKSTLLDAVELGVYSHIPDDGRQGVATVPDAVKIRAEDGRSVERVNISPFITNLPRGRDTRAFVSDDASGSTSQAANIVEALEVGATALLIDEDTSATNFMIRDHRMQELVAKEREPITPFIDKVRSLYDDLGVSTIIVVGGSGDYFDVADTVIMMDEYLPRDLTNEALEIAREHGVEREYEGGDGFGDVTPRSPRPDSLNADRDSRGERARAHGVKTIELGWREIDVSAVEQITDPSQLNAISAAILYCRDEFMDGTRTLSEVLDMLDSVLDRDGLDVLSPYPVGDHARFRRFELAAALNRLRGVRMEAGQ